MLSYEQSVIVGLVILGYAVICALFKYKQFDKPTRVLAWLMLITLINERVADYYAHNGGNNFISYGVFNPIQLLIIALYFNYSIPFFKSNKIGIYIGIAGCILGFINYYVVQSPAKMNTYFLLAESIIVVAMSLIAFYNMLQSDNDMRLRNNPHFWFTAIFLFFWTATFLFWGLYDFLIEQIKVNAGLLHLSLILINVITYIGFGTVFLLYPKMKTANEQ
ncbi:MAG TPA: hypothetical protein VGD89_13480 [Flavipsychrobacter sp.]